MSEESNEATGVASLPPTQGQNDETSESAVGGNTSRGNGPATTTPNNTPNNTATGSGTATVTITETEAQEGDPEVLTLTLRPRPTVRW